MAKEGLGGERTEPATSKKREDARKEGNVLKSQEINTAVLVLVMFSVLRIAGPWAARRVAEDAAYYLGSAGTMLYDTQMVTAFHSQLFELLLTIAPFLLAALVVGVAINVVQVGFLFTSKALMPKFSKINPISGFKRMFSVNSLAQLATSILKIAIIGYVIYNEYRKNINAVVFVIGKNPMTNMQTILEAIVNTGLRAGMAMCLIAGADFFYQRWRYEDNLKMSKQEIKEEYKQQEGNPEIKGKIKQKQRQMGMLRMMQAVPEADVVITNPTHYAVALKYDEKEASAPVVVAKGQDYVARRIREAAEEAGVTIVENKPVAQGLFRLCEIGDVIPEAMYQAVAEVLAYVYNLKNNTTGRAKRA